MNRPPNKFSSAVNESAVALINDDSTEVGYVHFGVVHIVQVANEHVAGRRSGILGPEFIPFAEAVKEASACESWSRFCLEKLDLLLAKAAATSTTAKRLMASEIRPVCRVQG